MVPVRKVMPQLRKRLCLDIPDAQFEAEARRIVSGAAKSKGSANYDFFQNLQRGIAV